MRQLFAFFLYIKIYFVKNNFMNQILSKEIKQIIIKGYKKPEKKKNYIIFYRGLLIISIIVFIFSMSYNISKFLIVS